MLSGPRARLAEQESGVSNCFPQLAGLCMHRWGPWHTSDPEASGQMYVLNVSLINIHTEENVLVILQTCSLLFLLNYWLFTQQIYHLPGNFFASIDCTQRHPEFHEQGVHLEKSQNKGWHNFLTHSSQTTTVTCVQ